MSYFIDSRRTRNLAERASGYGHNFLQGRLAYAPARRFRIMGPSASKAAAMERQGKAQKVLALA